MITFKNYYNNTSATFKGCKTPKRKPDYISRDYLGGISSQYWYGEDKKRGKYVIRESNHWVNYKDFNKDRKQQQCRSIASCLWRLKTNVRAQDVAGKCYLEDFKLL